MDETTAAENVANREPHASDCKNPFRVCDGTYIVYGPEYGDMAVLVECMSCGYTPNGSEYV